MIVEDYIYQKIDKPLFHLIGETADELGLETYVVGGFVRDLSFLVRAKILMSFPLVVASNLPRLSLSILRALTYLFLHALARLKSSTKAQRLSLSELGVRAIARTAVNLLSKMVRFKKTKSVETLPSRYLS